MLIATICAGFAVNGVCVANRFAARTREDPAGTAVIGRDLDEDGLVELPLELGRGGRRLLSLWSAGNGLAKRPIKVLSDGPRDTSWSSVGECTLVGDQSGDGRPDVVHKDVFGSSVFLVDSALGHVLGQVRSEVPMGLFQTLVADLDADGFVEVALAEGDRTRVWSSKQKRVLYQVNAGESVALVSDMNRDSWLDLAIGEGNDVGLACGVRVVSGKDGAELQRIAPTRPYMIGFGAAVTYLTNGADDERLLIAAPLALEGQSVTSYQPGRGGAIMYSLIDRGVVGAWRGREPGEGFGSQVVSLGDVNSDGADDFVIGVPERSNDDGGQVSGAVVCYSGESGEQLYELHGEASDMRLGERIWVAGDYTGDGVSDMVLVVGERKGPAGYYVMVSGRDGKVVSRIPVSTN